MRVNGTDITEDQQAAGTARMTGTFRARDITNALCHAGVPNAGKQLWTADSAADRLIQKARKAGMITINPTNKREWIALITPATASLSADPPI